MRVRAGLADDLRERGELAHGLLEAGAVELGELAGVPLGERGGPLVGFVELAVDARRALSVDERLEVPGDLQDFGIYDISCGHGVEGTRSGQHIESGRLRGPAMTANQSLECFLKEPCSAGTASTPSPRSAAWAPSTAGPTPSSSATSRSKVLPADRAGDPGMAERFRCESLQAAGLGHPNVLPVYDAGEAEGVSYVAMQWVDGMTLEQLVAEDGPLEVERAVAFTEAVAAALDHAHEHGIVHRDVKPGNVMVDGAGNAYLMDFGLSVRTDRTSALTKTGEFMATVDYAAPEQIQAAAIDRRADVYGLAGLAFRCLTGRVPFERESPVARLYAHLNDEPPVAHELRPAVPPAASETIRRGLAKAPDDRPATAGAFAAELRAATRRRRSRRHRGAERLARRGGGAAAAGAPGASSPAPRPPSSPRSAACRSPASPAAARPRATCRRPAPTRRRSARPRSAKTREARREDDERRPGGAGGDDARRAGRGRAPAADGRRREAPRHGRRSRATSRSRATWRTAA